MLGYEGEKLIKHYENCRLTAYQDKGGIWTIGWGNTFYENGSRVKEGDVIPQWRADQLFKRIASTEYNKVKDLTRSIPLKSYQLDALTSFEWNEGRLETSTLLQVILDNPNNMVEINRQFMRWIYVKGEVENGLIYRRKSESLLYRTGELKFFN